MLSYSHTYDVIVMSGSPPKLVKFPCTQFTSIQTKEGRGNGCTVCTKPVLARNQTSQLGTILLYLNC